MRGRPNVRVVIQREPPPPEKREPRKLSVFGYDFSNWASFVALTLAVLGFFSTQIDNFFVHPVPRMLAPSALNIYCSPDYSCQAGDNMLVRAGPIGFVDDLSSGHPYLVTDIKVVTELLDAKGAVIRTLTMPWFYFTNATQADNKEDPVGPFRVAPDSPVQKEIEFQPYRNSTPADAPLQFPYVDLLNAIAQGAVGSVRVTIVADTFKDGSFSGVCTAKVDARMIADAKRSSALLKADCA